MATGDDKPGSRGGGGVSTGLRYSGGKGETDRKSSGRDGVVEGAVLEAEDIVVCVLHPGGEDGSRAADGWVAALSSGKTEHFGLVRVLYRRVVLDQPLPECLGSIVTGSK